MKLGLFTALFSDLTLDEVIQRIRPLGIQAVELAAGNYGAPAHVHPDWISQPDKLAELRRKLDDAGLIIRPASSNLRRSSASLSGWLIQSGCTCAGAP